jgi:hypothetical protein
MMESADDAGVIAIVCTVRGNVYQYLENQLNVEQSWRGSPSQEIPSDLWNEINYRLNIIYIPCIKKYCSCYSKKNAFSVDKYLNCILTKYMLSYMFRLELPIVRTSVYKVNLVGGMQNV